MPEANQITWSAGWARHLHPSGSRGAFLAVCVLLVLLVFSSSIAGEQDKVPNYDAPAKQKPRATKDKLLDGNRRQRHPEDTINNNNNNNHDMTLPPKPTVTLLTSSSALVSWSLPPNSGLPVVFIRIQYRELNARRKSPQILWSTVEDDISPSTTSYVVKKLKTGATYYFRLAAVYSNNDNRHGPNSERFLVETPDKSKPPAFGPTIVELKAISPSALAISWQMMEPHVPVSGYVIQYREYSDSKSQSRRSQDRRRHTPSSKREEEEEDDDDDEDDDGGGGGDGNDGGGGGGGMGTGSFEEIKISNPKKKSASIKGLRPSTPYTVRMFSYSREGKSAISNSAVASTLPGRRSKENFPSSEEDYPVDPHGIHQPEQAHLQHHNDPHLPHHHEGIKGGDVRGKHNFNPFSNSSGDFRPPAGKDGGVDDETDDPGETQDELREAVGTLKNERMLLVIACSVLACFLVVMSLCFLLFICLRNKFVFIVPFSKKVYSNPRLTDREVRTF